MGEFGIRPIDATGYYWVQKDLLPEQQEAVALAIFMEVAERFEELQASGLWDIITKHSGFSEEDLPSDLLAFFMKVQGYKVGTKDHKKRNACEQSGEGCDKTVSGICGSLGITESQAVWKALDKPIQQTAPGCWIPQDHNRVTDCCEGALEWPSEFNIESIGPATKGILWGDVQDLGLGPVIETLHAIRPYIL